MNIKNSYNQNSEDPSEAIIDEKKRLKTLSQLRHDTLFGQIVFIGVLAFIIFSGACNVKGQQH